MSRPRTSAISAALIATSALAFAAAPAAAEERPIPGAGGWQFIDRLPGMDAPACGARIDGAQVDTILIVNNVGVPILIAGRSDWSGLSGEADVTLAVDGGAPARLNVFMVNNLVLALVADDALRQRLRAAHVIDWTLSFGRFHAEVTGLGVALDAVAACAAAQRRASPAPAK
jgi:hypothetical protein